MKTENKKSDQACFQNSNLLKMKTVFKKQKQEMKTENENVNQTHPYFSLETNSSKLYKFHILEKFHITKITLI